MPKFLFARIALLCCLFSAPAFSQTGFQPGLLLRATGDTLKGLILDRDWMINGRTVEFKSAENEPIRTYSPLEAPWFYVRGQWYAGKVVRLDKSPHELARLSESAVPLLVWDTLFLRAQVLGRANLFYCLDADSKPHFLLGKDSVEAEELILRKYLAERNGLREVVTLEKFRGQLAYYLEDCPGIKPDIQRVQYTQSSMIDLVRDYNICMSHEATGYVVAESHTKFRWEGIVLAGASLAQLHLNVPSDYTISQARFKPSIKPCLGLALNLVFPWNQQRWSAYAELSYWSYRTEARVPRIFSQDYTEDYDYAMHMAYRKTLLALRYQAPTGKFRPFFFAGFTSARAFKHDHTLTLYKHYPGREEVEHQPALAADVYLLQRGFTLGTGVRYGHFSLELRFDRGGEASNPTDVSWKTNALGLLAGYRL
ncbi:MAG: hypothetical protein IT260_24145 [Saprospiraceae bacterium]|nr:hypothetical protein [Saprospiraceae bacterium]